MSKPGRNDPCPCGSGKKYKQCCIARDRDAAAAAASAARQQAAAAAASRREKTQAYLDRWRERAQEHEEDLAFANASNRVLDLIDAGQLDDADAAARDLLTRYPDAVDGLERLGQVYEARGDRKQAVDHYRQALAFIGDDPDFDAEFVAFFHRKIEQLSEQSDHAP